jgi:hypothetical protein
LDQYKELLQLTDPTNGFTKYIETMTHTQPPAIPFLVPYFQDLLHLDQQASTWDAEDVEYTQKQCRFEKMYHMFGVAAELEMFRLTPYTGLHADREMNSHFVQHIKVLSRYDDASLGMGMHFGQGLLPDQKELSSPQGLKSLKKVVGMLSPTLSPTKE